MQPSDFINSIKNTYHLIKQEISIIPSGKLIKATLTANLAPFMILVIFALNGHMSPVLAIAAALSIFAISIIFVAPYIRNISALTEYVKKLAMDRRAEAPDLTFLSNVEELSEALERLNWSWENKRNQLEGMIAESKVLINSLPDALVMLDEELNIIKTNKVAQNIFGDKYLDKIDSILQKEVIAGIIRETLEDGKGRNIEYAPSEFVHNQFIISVEKIPIYSTSGITLIVAMHDITELKLTEKMFADFVANASHEIKTPLTSLTGIIETIQANIKKDPGVLDRFLPTMSEQANRMSVLSKDLLSLSALERTLKEPPTEKVDLNEILRTIRTQTQWHADKKNITININFANKLPVIIGDKNQLTQVFENLINNSIKYGFKDSEITVEAKTGITDDYMLKTLPGNPRHVISIAVTDQSEGIEEEHLPRLTERFYRIDKARSRKMGGTGLGLAIAKHILNRHQGALDIKSKVGKGSTFTVFLPVEHEYKIEVKQSYATAALQQDN